MGEIPVYIMGIVFTGSILIGYLYPVYGSLKIIVKCSLGKYKGEDEQLKRDKSMSVAYLFMTIGLWIPVNVVAMMSTDAPSTGEIHELIVRLIMFVPIVPIISIVIVMLHNNR